MSPLAALGGAGTSAAVAALLLAAPRHEPARRPRSVGRAAGSTAPASGASRSTGTTRQATRRRRMLLLAIAAAVVTAVSPQLALLLAVAGWALTRRRTILGRRQQDDAVRAALPDAVDLLLLCSGAGLALPLAHRQVADRVPGPLGRALVDAATAASSGQPRADALAASLGPLGDRAAGLADVLVDHLRYGAPLVPSLERLSGELRLDRRRHAEETARRVPVRLLGPLVACTLPAFGVLTVVPLVAASLRALPT